MAYHKRGLHLAPSALTPMSLTVAVIGDALLDVHATSATAVRPGGDIPAEVRLQPGGQGANLAVRLARRGVTVRLTCALGDDLAGAMLRSALAADGVEVRPIAAEATGSVVVLVASTGERTMLSQRIPLAGHVEAFLASEAGWLVLSGYLLLELGGAPLDRLATRPARVAIAGCALTASEAAGWLASAGALAPSLVVLNAEEASMLAEGADAAALAVRLEELLAAVVIVTEPGGASAAIPGQVVRMEAPPADPATDSTGAGDAVVAAIIADLLEEPWPPAVSQLERAMISAMRAGSAVAHAPGAQVRVPGEALARLSA